MKGVTGIWNTIHSFPLSAEVREDGIGVRGCVKVLVDVCVKVLEGVYARGYVYVWARERLVGVCMKVYYSHYPVPFTRVC